MTTELFKEALIEARKLKEVAEIDAKNKVIEAVTPIIKKMIAKEAAYTDRFLFGEEDAAMEPPVEELPMMDAPVAEPVAELPPMGGDTSSAPISPAGELVGMPMPDEEGKITMDIEGLFTLGAGKQGVSDATSQTNVAPPGDMGPGIPANPLESPPIAAGPTGGDAVNPLEAPVDAAASGAPGSEVIGGNPTATPPTQGLPGPTGAPGEEEPEPFIQGEGKVTSFQNNVRVVAEKVDYLYVSQRPVSSIVKESIKSRLFTLCEELDNLVEDGVLTSKKARIAENKLEFLFMKLNEAKDDNSYKDKGAHMTSLKEFAAKLFEEDALGPATADKATAHAEKVSGVAPGVDLFKEGEKPEVKEKSEEDTMKEALLGEDAPASSAFGDGKLEGDAENKNPQLHDKDALVAKPGAGIVESAPASTAFGDGEKAQGAENTSTKVHTPDALVDEKGSNSILEFDEKELREAVAKLRKENLARKIAAIRESSGALKGSVSDKEGLSVPKPKEGDQGSAKPVGGKAPAQKELKECGMTEEVPMDLPGNGPVGLPGAEGGVGGSDEVELTFSIDVDDLEALLNGSSTEFEAKPENGDMGDMGGDDDSGIEISDEPSDGESSDSVGLLTDKEDEVEETAMPSAPARPQMGESKTRKVTGKQIVESLTKQLNEQKLLTAKALYVSKFTVREDLSKKQKQKIAGYFDKASTLAEAKETYNKIKKILSESASATNLAGSASKPTSTGSAKLQEGVSRQPEGDEIDRGRWMLLAGIDKKRQK